jgi:hypothetical protein
MKTGKEILKFLLVALTCDSPLHLPRNCDADTAATFGFVRLGLVA